MPSHLDRDNSDENADMLRPAEGVLNALLICIPVWLIFLIFILRFF